MERIRKYAPRIIQETDNPISKSRSYEQREPYNRNNPAGIQKQTSRENLSCPHAQAFAFFFGWGIDQLQQKVINIFSRFSFCISCVRASFRLLTITRCSKLSR
jgi:hypothetical protein